MRFNRSARIVGVSFLSLVFLLAVGCSDEENGSSGGNAAGVQPKSPEATARLKAIIESFDTTFVPRTAHAAEISKLIRQGADVNVRSASGKTPLLYASNHGLTGVVKLLLAATVDVNTADNDSNTPLHLASDNGHAEVVKLLLAARANVNAADGYCGRTPLYRASNGGHIEVIKLLLAAKADVNAAEGDGMTPLYVAGGEDHVEIVKLLLVAKADANAYCKGSTPLLLASHNGDIEVVKLLLAAKADVNTASGRIEHRTPLHWASKRGHTEVVKLLLAAKADVNATDNDGHTPLHYASKWGHAEIVKLLVATKADVNAADKDGEGPKRQITLDLGDGATMKLVRIEAGKFKMGSPANEKGRRKEEGPQHQVTLTKPFYIGTTEVTQAQWKAVMGTKPWNGKRDVRAEANHPASYIGWDDATAFCRALSQKTGRTVRLPTEAEWEYACRAGTKTAYSFGDDSSKLGEYAWYRDNTWDKGETYAHPVGVKKPNALGLYDMHGNVWEWCADCYSLYTDADARDPKGPPHGREHMLRGGSWRGSPQYCRVAFRGYFPTGYRPCGIGFRVVSVGLDLN